MYNDKIKQHIYNWRENHPGKYQEYTKQYNTQWYEKNKTEFNRRRKDKYHFNTHWKTLCNIAVETL